MIDAIRQQLHLTTLQYQRLEDLVAAIGLPKEKNVHPLPGWQLRYQMKLRQKLAGYA